VCGMVPFGFRLHYSTRMNARSDALWGEVSQSVWHEPGLTRKALACADRGYRRPFANYGRRMFRDRYLNGRSRELGPSESGGGRPSAEVGTTGGSVGYGEEVRSAGEVGFSA